MRLFFFTSPTPRSTMAKRCPILVKAQSPAPNSRRKTPTVRATFFFSSRRRHTRYWRDWSSDVCSSDLGEAVDLPTLGEEVRALIGVGHHVGLDKAQLRVARVHVLNVAFGTGAHNGVDGGAGLVADLACNEIGRASCRERV